MGAQNDFAIVVGGDVGEFVEDVVVGSLPPRRSLWVQREVLTQRNLPSIKKLLEDSHTLHQLP